MVDNLLLFIEANPIWVKIIISLLVIMIAYIVKSVVTGIAHKRIKENAKYYAFSRVVNYVVATITIVILAVIWINRSFNVSTYMGLLSAGVAIALREYIINVVGWLFIEFKKPFDVTHRIEIAGVKGDVIDLRVFQFSLIEVSSIEEGEQSTGRIIDVPNSFVFTHPVFNYTKGFDYVWSEIDVVLTLESDWKLAKKLLLDMINSNKNINPSDAKNQLTKATRRYRLYYNKTTPIIYTSVNSYGVKLSVRYLCEPKKRRIVSNDLWEQILEMTETNDNIALAYETRRVVN